MKRIVLVLPYLLSSEGTESLLRHGAPGLARLASQGSVRRLASIGPCELPEAAYLGVRPDEICLAQGPLTVAALGYDPPERSVHFHLSLLSLDDDQMIQEPRPDPTDDEVRTIFEAAARLSTDALTLLPGRSTDHALVWTGGSIDLATTPKQQSIGAELAESLPVGDGEPLLRRLIDDSVNLLAEHKINRRRTEEGLAPLNLLWPWGQGFRGRVPNLAL